MANDKKISELPIAQTINATDKSILISNNADYQFDFASLLQFINSGLAAGANLSFGTVLPQNNFGKNGDVFINTATGSFAQKIAGVWTVVYTIAAASAATGNAVLFGNTIPGSATGSNGDTFINTLTGIFYKKNGGSWSQVFSMQTGPQGPQGVSGTNGANGANGKTILNGAVNPANSIGTDGDFYINTSSYYLFGPKTAGVWGAGISLIISGVQFEETANKNIPNGYAGLDGTGKVAPAQLPSYVDDVLEFSNVSALPVTGEAGKIYITTDNNNQYRWSGTSYIQIVSSPGTTDAIPEGTNNKYFSVSRVLNALLAGISFGTSAVISATDTVLQALGKLQAQINNLFKIPNGGTAGQVLAKVDSTDGNVHWVDAESGGYNNESESNLYPLLAVNSAAYLYSFGTSMTAAYLLQFPFWDSYSAQFAVRLGLYQDNTNYAQSASNSFSALRQAYAHLPTKQNRNIAIIVEMGLNDFQGGILQKEYNRLEGILTSFLANSFLESAYPGNAPGSVKTGSWNSFDSTSHGGKANSLNGTALQSTTVGSTYTLFNTSNEVVIGTYANDGTGTNPTGSFEVYLNDVLYTTYNPDGKTSGITDVTGYDNSITPDAVIIKGCSGKTVKIVTTSNNPTIIDYFGSLGASNNFAPVFVSLIPRLADAAYILDGPSRTPEILSEGDRIIKRVVDSFRGYPVTVVEINKYYDPNTQTIDNRHANIDGHKAILKAFLEKIQAGVNGWPVPHVPIIGGERFLTVGNNGVMTNYDAADYIVNPTELTSANFSTGRANIAGKPGQISADTDFLYLCVGINTWVRVALIQDKIDLFLAPIDDSSGAKTSSELNSTYPAAVIYQVVRGIQFNYQKVSSIVWEKTAKSTA